MDSTSAWNALLEEFRSFGGQVGDADGDADGRGGEGGGVVDAVTHHEYGLALGHEVGHNLGFLMREAALILGDAEALRDVLQGGGAVP